MASKSEERDMNNRIIKSLLTQLSITRQNPVENNIFELIGGIISANKPQYNTEVVNKAIKDIIKELRKIDSNNETYEEVLIAYVDEMEQRKRIIPITGSKQKIQTFEEIKEEIEDTIILFYAHDLVSLDFIKQERLDDSFLTNTKVIKAYEKGKISKQKVIDFLASKSIDTKSNLRDKEDDKYTKIANLSNGLKEFPESKKLRESYLALIPKRELARLYIEGVLEGKDLRKFSIKVEDVLSLDAAHIIELLQKKPISGMRAITQEEILALYGIKLSGKELIMLSERGKIAEEKIITLATNNAADEFSEDKKLKPEDFLEFYNAERLIRLAKENKINSRFVEVLNEKIISQMPKEKVEEYYQKIISDIRISLDDNGLRTTQTSLELFKLGILPSEALKNNIESLDSDIGILTVIENAVDTETLAKLFNENAISVDTLKDIYLSDEIIKLYNDGILSSRAILAIPEEERNIYLDVNMEEGSDETKTILELYTKYDGIDIKDVKRLLKDKVEAEEIYNNLDRKELSKEKIRELFLNYLISQDELGKLRDEGIITLDDYEKYSNDLGRAEFFEKLKKTRIIKATGHETGGNGFGGVKGPRGDGPEPPKKEKISLETRREVLETLGGDTNTAVIYGHDSSLNGYTLVGFEDDGLVVFENFENPRNATYIMTYQQAAYFMENTRIANNVLNEKDIKVNYTGTKTELRDTENVRRKLHSKHWAKNVADAITDLSVEARNRLKPNKKYLKTAQDIIDKSKNEYERN